MTLEPRPGLQIYQIQRYLLEQSAYLSPRSGQGLSRLISCSRRGTPRLIQLVGWESRGENPGDRTPRFGQAQTSLIGYLRILSFFALLCILQHQRE